MAMKVWEYNQKGWSDPDQTADWPIEKRYTPETCLSDLVDAPPASRLTWAAADGVWDAAEPVWRDASGKKVAWDPQAQALFDGVGGVIRLTGNVSCSGLSLGKGYTLVVGTNTVGSRVSISLEPGSALDVTLKPAEANGRWASRGSRSQTGSSARWAIWAGTPKAKPTRGTRSGSSCPSPTATATRRARNSRMTGFGPGGGPPGVDTYARGFSLVPAEYRRCALWG
jgi:hypothetical protein